MLLLCLSPAWADEGMWPFNQFPKEAVAQKHKFDVSAEFLDGLRMASVRLTGGSGSFVSPNGLVLTNQHLVTACLAQYNFLNNGFYTASRAEEKKCFPPGSRSPVEHRRRFQRRHHPGQRDSTTQRLYRAHRKRLRYQVGESLHGGEALFGGPL